MARRQPVARDLCVAASNVVSSTPGARRRGATVAKGPPGLCRIAGFPPKCSNPVCRKLGTLRMMMRNQNSDLRNAAARSFVGDAAQRIVAYAMAVLSVAVAILAAELIARILHAEPITSLMLCAVIFAAWFGGFGPALMAIVLALFAFHYYLVPPINSFGWKHNLFAGSISEVAASHSVFHYVSLCCIRGFSAENSDRSSPAFRR